MLLLLPSMKGHWEELDFLPVILAAVQLFLTFGCFPRNLHMNQSKECFQHFMQHEEITIRWSQPF